MYESSDVAIVIPAYNAAPFLRRTLPTTLRVAGNSRVLVVDAHSSDATGEIARALGAEVIELPRRAGPAEARNAGVQELESEVVLFLDADCLPHGDVLDRVRIAFREDAGLISLTGSYDAQPPEQNFFSQYMNLRHHFFHQIAAQENATFWAGIGAVRRKIFLEVGGFDADRFPRPQIEDIELAVRLRGFGRMALDPELCVTHLKRWTLRSVVETDIRCRAIPWAKLILERGQIPADLNLRWSQRIAALFAPLTLIALVVAPLAAAGGALSILAICAACVGASIGLSASLLRFFARCRGVGFALRAWLFHQVHLTYSAAVFGALTATQRLRRRRGTPPREPTP